MQDIIYANEMKTIPAGEIFNALTNIDHDYLFYSVMVFSNQTTNTGFHVEPTYVRDNKYIIRRQFANLGMTYILWKSSIND
jgi:hypothetical protein